MKHFEITFNNSTDKNKSCQKLILSQKQSATQYRKHMNCDYYFVIQIHTNTGKRLERYDSNCWAVILDNVITGDFNFLFLCVKPSIFNLQW